jgi:hypothetical protein
MGGRGSDDMNDRIDDRDVDLVAPSALGVISRAEIDIQIATAKAYPRSMKAFQHSAIEMATIDQETAESCFYRLPRKEDGETKWIEGPSVRLAEIVAVSYGNLRCGARLVEEGERFVTAQGVVFDMERNVFYTSETRRRITTSKGRRYGDDMIATTVNAACSIALRNAIFRAVPLALVKPVLTKAKEVAIGKGKSIGEMRLAALQNYERIGASQADVLAMLGRVGVEDITLDDIVTLRGLFTAIKDREITLEQALHPERQQEGRRTRTVKEVEVPGAEAPKPEAPAPAPAPVEEKPPTPEALGTCRLCGGEDGTHTDLLCPERGLADEVDDRVDDMADEGPAPDAALLSAAVAGKIDTKKPRRSKAQKDSE